MQEESTRTAHGTPIGTSEEEEGLQQDGLLPEADPAPAQYDIQNEEDKPVPSRKGQGKPLKEEDIPLSEVTGEGRIDQTGNTAGDAKRALRESLDRD